MEIAVLKIRQAGRTLYLGSMTAEQLLRFGVTTEWDPNIGWDIEHQGYQRAPVEVHYKGIADYLLKTGEPFMPNGALLSARDGEYGRLQFRKVAGDQECEFGYLAIPEGRLLFIVDYQHRWRGFRHALEKNGHPELKEAVIPVTIMPDVDRAEEIRQFYVINSKQRRIETDLALALLQTMAGEVSEEELVSLVGKNKRFRIRATRLTFRIAAATDGPWAGRIKQPHDLPEVNAVLSFKSFVDSLQLIVSSRSPVSHMDDDQLIQVIGNYWSALSQLMPESFGNPRDHSIQKTPGVFSMQIVAAKTVFKLCQRQNDYSPRRMEDYLSTANTTVGGDSTRYMESGYWVSRGPVKQYGGSGGHRALATLIRNKIEARDPVVG